MNRSTKSRYFMIIKIWSVSHDIELVKSETGIKNLSTIYKALEFGVKEMGLERKHFNYFTRNCWRPKK